MEGVEACGVKDGEVKGAVLQSYASQDWREFVFKLSSNLRSTFAGKKEAGHDAIRIFFLIVSCFSVRIWTDIRQVIV